MFMYHKILALSKPTVLTKFFFFFCLNVGLVLMNIRTFVLPSLISSSYVRPFQLCLLRLFGSHFLSMFPFVLPLFRFIKGLNHIRYLLGLPPVCGLTVHSNLIRYNISRNFALNFLSV